MSDPTKYTVTAEELEKELAFPPTKVGDTISTGQKVELRKNGGDIDRLLEASAKLLKSKNKERIDAVSDYERRMVDTINNWREQTERLRIEVGEAVLKLEAEHKQHMAQLDSIIAKLEALRGS